MYYILFRTQPTGNKMPTVTLGSAIPVSAAPAINLPASTAYPNTFGITGTCSTGDTCQVWQVSPAVQECTGTTTCTYTTPILAVGTYNYNAIDTTSQAST